MYNDGISLVILDNECIYRHKIIKKIMDIYEQYFYYFIILLF